MQQQSNDSLLRAQDDSLPLQVLFSRSEDPPSNRIFALRVSISTAPPHWEASSSSTSRWRCPTVTSRCWRRCWRAPTPRWTRLLRRGRVELGAWDGSLIAWITAIFRYPLVEYPDVPRKGAMHILRHACMGGAWQLAARVLHVERVAQPSLTAYCTSPDSGALVRCLPQLATTS